jgi:hypothetical protein
MAITIISRPSGLCFTGNLPRLTFTADADVRIQLLSGSITLLDETYTPDFDGAISLDITEVIKNSLSVSIPDVDVYVQPTLVKTFTIKLNDNSYSFTAIRAGIKNLNTSTSEFLKKNFLTWQPQQKNITATQSEWLTYYATQYCYLYVAAVFNDHTVVSKKISDFTGGKTYAVNVSVSCMTGLFGQAPERYNIYVSETDNALGRRLSNVQQYIVEALSHNEQVFCFQNSLGGIDTIRCSGEAKHAPEYTSSTALMNDTEDTYYIEKKDLQTQNTGWLSKSAATWLHDFFTSKQRYKYEDDTLQPVVIDEITAETSTIEDLISFEFTYRPAIASDYLNLKRDFGKKTCTWSEYINIWDTVYVEDWNRNTWFTTDTDVAYMLSITDVLIGLAKTYSLLNAFNGQSGSFIAVSVETWQKMPAGTRASRINNFKWYINQLEAIDINAIQTNDVYRQSDAVPGDAIEKWLLATGSWNDGGVWDDKQRWIA